MTQRNGAPREADRQAVHDSAGDTFPRSTPPRERLEMLRQEAELVRRRGR